MKFKYSARNQQGELQVGAVEAASREAAISILNGHELFVLSVESAEKKTFTDALANFFNRVKSRDLVIFSRQLSTLLEAKIPIGDSLKNLYRQTDNKLLKEVIFDLSADISSGVPFSQALSRHENVFSDFFVNMIRAAEVTGRVDEAMGFMADYLEKEETLTGKVRSALIYPAFVIGLFVVVVIVMVVYVFPQLKPIFTETGVTLPIYTRLILGAGDFILAWWWAIIAIGVVVGVVLIDYFRTDEGKSLLNDLELKIPVIGDLFTKIYITRFSQSAAVLIKGGVSVVQAVRITGRTIGSFVYEDELEEIAEKIKEGELMSRALEEAEHFPLLVSNLVAIGETTGRVDQLLEKVADFYTRQIDEKVSNLVELIQPALMVFIAVFVGFLFASILLPIYNLAQAF
ncbi:MAG: type II secretion system F family protein [Candidatus Paceibacterota bacterium]